MARPIRKKRATKAKKFYEPDFSFYWTSGNVYALIGGVVALILGFYLLSVGPWHSTESLVVSPIVLFVAYVAIFPLAILYKKRRENGTEEEPSGDVGEG
ncbi:MAG: hypothetical protein GF419_08695 [Ignavibacteriales bacterium]|nr:hypothetical protein [Ignavibacteriales bacterium]